MTESFYGLTQEQFQRLRVEDPDDTGKYRDVFNDREVFYDDHEIGFLSRSPDGSWVAAALTGNSPRAMFHGQSETDTGGMKLVRFDSIYAAAAALVQRYVLENSLQS